MVHEMLKRIPLFFALILSACKPSPGPGPAEPTSPASGSTTGEVTADALARICAAEHVDATSEVFRATKGGQLHRIVVTPTRKIADMGNLIFDTEGELLGEDTGGEVPWDDEAFMTKERARVAALMDGAEVEQKPTQTCVGATGTREQG
jgi:hypothetical protein